MRRLVGVTVIVALFALAACTPAAPVGPEPASADPASAQPSSASPVSVEPTASASPSSDPADDESVEEQGDEASEPEVSFKDGYTYPDGVEVDVTKVKHGRITAQDVSWAPTRRGGRRGFS